MQDPRYEPPAPFDSPQPQYTPPQVFTPVHEAPVTLASVARDIAAMLREPRAELRRSPRPWAVWARVVGLYFIGMFFAGLVAQAGVKMSGATNMLDDMRRTWPPLAMLAMAGVLAPLWEETAFRLPLAPFHVARVLPALGLVAALILPSKSFEVRWLLGAPIVVMALVCVATLLSKKFHARITALWSRHFRQVLTLSIVAFGFAHAGNYTFAATSGTGGVAVPILAAPLLVTPLLVTPQIIAGILLAYTRQRLGFWYGVLLHSSVNTALILMVLAAPAPHEKSKPAPAPAAPRRQPALPERAPARPAAGPSAPER